MGVIEDNKRLEEADRKYVWHPFTQMKDWMSDTPIIISEGRDCFVKDTYGRWYLDGVSSLWVNLFGHRKKELDEALRQQIEKISHSTLLGLGNEPSILLAERLAGIMAKSLSPVLNKVFYSDNGSTSVEVALKMAFHYWKLKGVEGKNAFMSLRNAYHGDTIGAVSVGGVDLFHNIFGPLLFKAYKSPSPYCYRCELGLVHESCGLQCLNEMEDTMKSHAGEIAGLIIEPLVQAAGGMLVFPKGYLKGVRDLCTKYNILMLADEVATGFGRTGKMFACEHESVSPDIICLSKGITGGYMPLAVTIAAEEVFDAFLGEYSEFKTFFHGHSYTGNPLACSVANACLDIFEKDNILESLAPKIGLLEGWLNKISAHPHVGEARNKGLMSGVELVMNKKSNAPYPVEEKIGWRVAYEARNHGVLIRPLGGVVVLMPPLIISLENLQRLLEVIELSIEAATAQL